MHLNICVILTILMMSLSSCRLTQMTWQKLDASLSAIDSVSYNTDDGREKQIYVTHPRYSLGRKHKPAIVFIHGGAWKGGAASTFFPHMIYYAHQGLVTMSIDYRLLGVESSDIRGCLNDCAHALRRIKEYSRWHKIDSNKIVVCGESAGGHLAAGLQMLLPGPGLEAAGLVLLNPVLDLNTPVFLHFLDDQWVKNGKRLSIHDAPDPDLQEKAKAISPIHQTVQKLPPVLLINGDQDVITPLPTAKAFATKIKEASGDCKLVIMEGQSHAFAIPHYKSSEHTVLESIKLIDTFLNELGMFKQNIQLIGSGDKNWITTSQKK